MSNFGRAKKKLAQLNKAKRKLYMPNSLDKMSEKDLIRLGRNNGIYFGEGVSKKFIIIKLLEKLAPKKAGKAQTPVKNEADKTDGSTSEKALSKMNKDELIARGKEVGLRLDPNLKNKIMIKAIKNKINDDAKAEKENAKKAEADQKEEADALEKLDHEELLKKAWGLGINLPESTEDKTIIDIIKSTIAKPNEEE